MPKSLNEWKNVLEKLSGEDLENIIKGINSLKKVDNFISEFRITAFQLLANEVLEERLRKMEKRKILELNGFEKLNKENI